MITYRKRLNLVPGYAMQKVYVSQYDSDIRLEFELYTSEGTFTVESGTTVVIQGTKPDGNGISIDGTLTATQDTDTGTTVYVASFDFDVQMAAVSGKSIYELALYHGAKVLNTANFILFVEKAALDADTIQSDSVLRNLDAIIEGAETATQAAEEAEDAADRAEEAARTLTIDDTLTQAGQAADAKKVGDEIADLKDDLTQIEPGMWSDEAKNALLDCFAHVAWVDGDGQEYVDTLSEALGIHHEWDDGYIWLYKPSEGLLSGMDYATSNLVGQGGTETLTQNALRLHSDRPATESAGQNAIRFNLTPNTVKRLMGKFELIDYATSQIADTKIGGGFQVMVTNGTNGLLVYVGASNQNIAVEYYNGSTKQSVVTQIPITGEHIFEALITNTGQTLKIDGVTVINNAAFSTFYTTVNRVGVAATNPLFVTANGVTTDIMWLAAYTE